MKGKKPYYLLFLLLVLSLTIYGCGGGGGGGGGAAAGANTITLTGGGGATTTDGGDGGYWYMETYSVKGVKISRTGTVNTSFTVPNYNPPADLGANPLTISATTNIDVYDPVLGNDPAAGTPYMVVGDANLYISDDDGSVADETPVTGLQVDAGVTLTLGLNYDSGGLTGQDWAYITFSDDINILGTVKTKDLTAGNVPTNGVAPTIDTRHGAPATARDMGALDLEGEQIFIRTGGAINATGLAGTAATTERGGDGGYIYLYADNFVINEGTIDNSGGDGAGTGIGGDAGVSTAGGSFVYIDCDGGALINKGPIYANGGTGSAGGEAAYLELYADSLLYNTGSLMANGGTGLTGNGGNADYDIYLYAYYGSIFNSGNISQKGGDAAVSSGTGTGGDGGYVYISAGDSGYVGDFINSGDIDVSSGSAITAGSGGGSYGYIYMYAYGAIKNSGDLTLAGGNGVGAGSAGGDGGYLEIDNYVPYDEGYDESLPVRPIQISGNISLNGGAGVTGGAGGDFYIYQAESDDAQSEGGIELLGYTSADLSGGNGTSTGGDADWYSMEIYTYEDDWEIGDYLPVGPITNEIAITAKGGNGTGAAGDGGDGGYIEWETDGSAWDLGTTSKLTNSGKVDVSGGSGGTSNGGDSGGIYWYGHDGVTNSGELVLEGGDSVGGTGGVGDYYSLEIYASLDITNSGIIRTTGGSGVTGGDGSDGWTDYIQIYAGGQVKNSGSIYTNGGDGTTTNGNGGNMDIFSETAATQNTAGLITVADGAGAGAAGTNGEIWIDWVDVTPTDGTLP